MAKTKLSFLSLLGACSLCVALSVAAARPALAGGNKKARIAWDWSGIIGSGQSLSVGTEGTPIVSTTQPYGNLKLTTGNLPWPIDANDPTLAMAPLVEPVGRLSHEYPSSWPVNIAGETYHTSMADELTALVRTSFKRDFVSVQSEVGESGQGMVFLKKNAVPKGVNGHSYQAALVEATAIQRLAKAAGKTFGVGAVVVTHGEADCGNPEYEAQLRQLWRDYNTDLRAITGQKQTTQMIVSQQNSLIDHSAATQAQWRIGVDYPKDMVCSGPKYQYQYAPDAVHLTTDGYRALGEKYAEVYYERVVIGKRWEPLQPTAVDRKGAVITVHFHVPFGPLVWDTSLEPPHASVPEWKDAKGFEVSAASGSKVSITSVAIVGDSAVIACASDPGPRAMVSYAMIVEKEKMTSPYGGTHHWGLLRDSDPFVGAVTGKAQPNYAVAFDMNAP